VKRPPDAPYDLRRSKSQLSKMHKPFTRAVCLQMDASRLAKAWLGVAPALTFFVASLTAQSCDASTGAAGGTEGGACVEMAAMVSFDGGGSNFLEVAQSLPTGESFVWSAVQVPPASTTTATDLRQALGLVGGGGVVLATGGEFRQMVGLIRTPGIDRSHPLQLHLDYRSFEVDAWRTAGDGVGTADDPFGPGWRASWGDLLIDPNEVGDPLVRIDEHGVRWTHTQVSTQSVNVGPIDVPTTWRVYDAQAGTRLVLEYYYLGGQVVPRWLREWPDRTRVEYGSHATSGVDHVVQRMYRGAYTAPDWEVAFDYDPSTGRIVTITDARGILHTFTWTTYGSVARVTKLSSTVPVTWTPSWPVIETNFEYELSSPYRLLRVRRPSRLFLDDQDRSGAYDLPAEGFTGEVVTRFTHVGSSNRIERVYDESTGLSRQMLEVAYDAAVTWRVSTLTEGESSSLPGQGQRVQTMVYPQSGQSLWVDPRGVVRLYDYDTTNFGSSPRQWRVVRIEEFAGANDPRPFGDPSFHFDDEPYGAQEDPPLPKKRSEGLEGVLKKDEPPPGGGGRGGVKYDQVIITSCYQGLGFPSGDDLGDLPWTRHQNLAVLVSEILGKPVQAYDCLIQWDGSVRRPIKYNPDFKRTDPMGEGMPAVPVPVEGGR